MKIAILIGGIVYEIQRRILDGVMRYTQEHDISAFVFTCNGDMYAGTDYGIGEFHIYHLPELSQYDGIIYAKYTIQNVKVGEEITKRLLKLNIPVVSIEAKIPGMKRFYTDNSDVMKQMTLHLLKEHHVSDICYLSGPKQNLESRERLDGYRQALQDCGITSEEENIYYGNFWVNGGGEIINEILRDRQKFPQAIICANDDMAIGAYLKLYDQNIKVGKDVLLTGFDNSSHTRALTPEITTVEKPQRQMAYEACDWLVAQKGRKIAQTDLTERQFPVKFHFRESCGCTEKSRPQLEQVQITSRKEHLEATELNEELKNMASDLNDCEQVEEFYEALKGYIVKAGFENFYLCMCKEEKEDEKFEYASHIRENYTNEIEIPLAYENGAFSSYDSFQRENLLPQSCMEKLRQKTLLVMPLHFRKHCMGYCVMGEDSNLLHSTQLQNWFMNISNALENIRRQSRQKQLIHRLNHIWCLDSMTQLYNRAGFFHYSERIMEECRKEKKEAGLLFLDMNGLKMVNDTYGHEEGDFFIKTVADVLRSVKKGNHMVMRYGGDEFVIFGKLEGDNFLTYKKEIAEELEGLRRDSRKPYEMTVSTGFYSIAVDGEFKLDQLIEKADMEMYKMKREQKEKGNGKK